MKSTGIVRQIDDLGRIVIPIELRKTLNIKRKDFKEILVEGNNIILSKYVKGCLFCGEMGEIFDFEGTTICKNCLEKLNKNNK